MQVEERGPAWLGLTPDLLPGWVTLGRAFPCLGLGTGSLAFWEQQGGEASLPGPHPCPSPQTRLQAGVGYGNTLSCIRTVYRKESVSVPLVGGWSPNGQGVP